MERPIDRTEETQATDKTVWGWVVAPDPQVSGDGSWTYTIAANMPWGPQEISGVRPADRKWDTNEWDIVSAPPGLKVEGALQANGQVRWFLHEDRASEECDEQQAALNTVIIQDLLARLAQRDRGTA